MGAPSAHGVKSSQRRDLCLTMTKSVRGTGIVSAFEGDVRVAKGTSSGLAGAAQNRTGWRPFQSGEYVRSAFAPSVRASPFERARSVWAARVYGSYFSWTAFLFRLRCQGTCPSLPINRPWSLGPGPILFGRMPSCSARSTNLLPVAPGFIHRLFECQRPSLCPVLREHLRGQGRANRGDGLLVIGKIGG